jgi:hypothetical protein
MTMGYNMMKMDIRKFLAQPFPFPEERWKNVISISLFICVVLLIFQPFQLSQVSENIKVLIILGYGGATFVALIINLLILPWLFKNIFREQTWTVKKQIVFFIWILFTIGIGNYFYSITVTDFFSFNLHHFLLFQLYTLLVGLFPITFIVVIAQNKLYKRNFKAAQELNNTLSQLSKSAPTTDKKATIWAENGRDKIELEASELLFIEAMGNYVMVHFFKDTKYKKELLRCSFKKAFEAVKEVPQLIQCHRTYLVNLIHVEDAQGNAQGYSLQLKGNAAKVPVSRKFIPQIKAHLQQLSR